MDASLMKRMKELEDENRRLKKMYIEKNSLPKLLRTSSKKSCKASSATRTGETSSD
jgi:putative transposase